MSQVIVFLLLGIGSGGLIAGIGMGVVLSYRGAGVINLATGAVAMLAGYFFWAVRLGKFASIPAVPAAILTLIFAAIVGVLFDLLVIRPQRTATPLAKLIATLGALLIFQAFIVITFGQSAQPQPVILPSQNVILFGDPVPVYNFIIGGAMLVIMAGLAALYRWTRFGLGTRAAAENEAHAMFMGLSPNWLSLSNTVLMSLVMGVTGLLAASVVEPDPGTLPLMVIPGLAVAIFGRFTSFTVTCIGGLVLGMAESLLTYFSNQNWFPTDQGPGYPLPGTQDLLIFLVLVVAMYFRAGKIPGRGDVLERRLPAAPPPKHPMRSALICGVIGAVAILLLPGGYRNTLDVSLITAVFLLSVVIITGYLGQVSIVQLALGGSAGFAVSHFATDFGIGFPWAPILGVIIAVLLGLFCGIPALRVRGVSLAVVTLAAAVAIENFGFGNTTWGGGIKGSSVPAPALFGWQWGPNAPVHGLFGAEPSPLFGWFVLIVLLIVGLLVSNLRRSALGQDMLAVRANERAAAAAGINIRQTKLLGFAISAGVAGVGGVLLAYAYSSITPTSYDTATSLALIAFAYICGISTVAGAIWGGMIFIGSISAYALLQWFGLQGEWFTLAGGALLILTLVQQPQGVATAIFYGDKPAIPVPRFLRRGSPPLSPALAESIDEAKVA
ncbi:MAG TPA: ABC transporter permease [Streptosporangiaceae bacterium]|nr:ABC transporter permease [Streptosporangiaceae bacterium]